MNVLEWLKWLPEVAARTRAFIQERRIAQEEEKLPQVIKWMDEVEARVRQQEDLHAGLVPALDDEVW